MAAALIALAGAGFLGAASLGSAGAVYGGDRARAAELAAAGVEAARSVRDDDFDALSSGTYGVSEVSDGTWEFTGSSDSVGQFTRAVTVSDVSDTVVRIASTVTWDINAQRGGSITMVSDLTNWQREAGGPADCTGPPDERAPECDEEGPGGGGGNGGGPSN